VGSRVKKEVFVKESKLRKIIKAQKVKPLTPEEYKKLRLNAYKPAK
jgi:hypothetical protein